MEVNSVNSSLTITAVQDSDSGLYYCSSLKGKEMIFETTTYLQIRDVVIYETHEGDKLYTNGLKPNPDPNLNQTLNGVKFQVAHVDMQYCYYSYHYYCCYYNYNYCYYYNHYYYYYYSHYYYHRFLATHISEDLSWTTNTMPLVKKAQQRLYFLRILRKTNLQEKLLVSSNPSVIQSVRTNCISTWYSSCLTAERRALQRVINTAQKIIGCPLPCLEDLFSSCCLNKDSQHPERPISPRTSCVPPAALW
ncbi:hypothetical protein NFI96_022545 [Prochilodus magdalenae]|nr:hypothetical protein NFI96_022545 [Prochilodus magdalenae]